MIFKFLDNVSPCFFLPPSINRTNWLRVGVVVSACLAFVATSVEAATLTLEWDPPTDTVTSGYIVLYGPGSGNYTARADVGYFTKYRIDGLADDTNYCFAVQAYDRAGTLSARSTEVCSRTPTSGGSTTPPPTGGGSTTAGEIVLYASDATSVVGNWARAATSSGAGGTLMRSPDYGWSSANAPVATPSNYFEARFDAVANTPYRVWLRLRAGADSKWNDSVWVQFSDAVVNGQPAYRIGSTSGLLVNLERCNACGVSGWGWFNSAYWLTQNTAVTFAQSGSHTIRIQAREDGADIDQIVISPVRFMSAPPGSPTNDSTILTKTTSTSPTSPPPTSTPSGSTPYSGTPVAIPGTIEAAHFDNGGKDVAYFDSSYGNSGGAFRTTDVDVQYASVGGYNIGWTSPGEWVNYSVNVSTPRSYTVSVQVASVGGGSLQVSAGGPSNTSSTISVPNTGGWQTWTTVSVPITLAAGQQKLTVKFLTANINLRSIAVK